MESIAEQIVEILVPGIREEIAGRTLLVPPERMQNRVAERNADFHVARHGEIVVGDQPVPVVRMRERVAEPILDFPLDRHGGIVDGGQVVLIQERAVDQIAD